MNVAQRFGANLTRYREAAGLTQEELALRAAVHRTQVGLLENGQRQPRIDTFAKLAGALGVDANALMAGILWVPPTTDTGRFELSED